MNMFTLLIAMYMYKEIFLCAINVFKYYCTCIYFLKDTSKKKENAKCEETRPTGMST